MDRLDPAGHRFGRWMKFGFVVFSIRDKTEDADQDEDENQAENAAYRRFVVCVGDSPVGAAGPSAPPSALRREVSPFGNADSSAAPLLGP